jgi:hypothetical protein
MKKFAFPLDRVLQWRRTQAQIEESKLAQLHGELRALENRRAALDRERTVSEQAVLSDAAVTGADLAALDAFQRFTIAERQRLDRARGESRQRIAGQVEVVAAKRRDVRLLEHLREERLKTWTAAQAHELEIQAAESYLARFSAC